MNLSMRARYFRAIFSDNPGANIAEIYRSLDGPLPSELIYDEGKAEPKAAFLQPTTPLHNQTWQPQQYQVALRACK